MNFPGGREVVIQTRCQGEGCPVVVIEVPECLISSLDSVCLILCRNRGYWGNRGGLSNGTVRR